jgi:hypothetical protein
MMLRSLLFFTLTTGCIAAATITTQVNCNGVVSNSSCSDSYFSASVSIGAGFSISADALQESNPFLFASVSATATFQDDYLFTVTGGSGSGMVEPCITASWDADRGGAGAGISFGSASLSGGGSQGGFSQSCEGGSPISLLPFTFGVPQMVSVFMSASADAPTTSSEGDASASLDGFQFFDDSGNQLSNVHFSLVSASVSPSVPEPGMWFPLLAVFLLLFGLGRRPPRSKPSL